MTRFREVQSFRGGWAFWLVVGGIAFGAASAWRAAGPPPPTFSAWAAIAVAGVFLVWLAAMQLVTEVKDDHLRVKFQWLWTERRILYGEIAKAAATRYRPVLDYGGWGVRGFPTVRAFNVRGSHGVLLEFYDGRQLMIGSQRAAALEAAIHERIGAAAANRASESDVPIRR